ncbi:hypothetical protein [Streptomyces sp. NBC_01304]|uniref:hypothetical protein n=1 Tax=Streptomyces sp. NBC_01304 TaxID=2903818 RepID=UPI003FA3CF4F
MAEGDTDFFPGDGPTSRLSVSLTAGTLQAIRCRVGKRGVSAYLEKAVQRQIERDNLSDLVADFDQVNGPADPEAVAAKRVRLTGSVPSSIPERPRDQRPQSGERGPRGMRAGEGA